jgi:hypothetical protein
MTSSDEDDEDPGDDEDDEDDGGDGYDEDEDEAVMLIRAYGGASINHSWNIDE